MSRLILDLGAKATWKKGCLWTFALVALVAIGLVVVWKSALYRASSEQRATELARRNSKKIRLGDDVQTVRLRLGIPDTITRDTNRTVWLYRASTVSTDSQFNVVVFDGPTGTQSAYAIYMSPTLPTLWVPEDGLTPTEFTDADEAVESFEKVLGAPCFLSYEEDSTAVRYLFRLSRAELAQDSVYQRLATTDAARFPFRFLRIGLRNGKKVWDHGWAMTKRGRAACSSTKQ